MNKDTIQGDWEQLKGKAKQQYAKLTDNDIMLLKGKRDEFLGKVQEAYGKDKDEAEKELADIEKSCGCSSSSNKAA